MVRLLYSVSSLFSHHERTIYSHTGCSGGKKDDDEVRASLGIGETGNMGVSLHLCMSTSLLVRSATHRRRSPCSFRLPHGCRRQCPILLCVPAACGWKTNVEKLAACQRSPCLPKWQKLLAAELVREALDSSIAAR